MFFSFTYRFLNIIAPILVLVFSHSFILYLCTPDNSRPPPLLFSPVENRHCSRVVVVVLGISLYISSTHSALAALFFPTSRQSTKRKQQYSPVGVALTFHLFFLLLFFLFLLCSAHVTSGPDGGFSFGKTPTIRPIFQNFVSSSYLFFFFEHWMIIYQKDNRFKISYFLLIIF